MDPDKERELLEAKLRVWLHKYNLEWRYKLIDGAAWIQIRKRRTLPFFGWVTVGKALSILQTPGVSMYEFFLLGKLRANNLIDHESYRSM